MSKILVHAGPPKTGSTQFQALLNENSEVLNEHLITKLSPQLKPSIRPYFQAFNKARRASGIERFDRYPWFSDISESAFLRKDGHEHSIVSEEALFKLFPHTYELSAFDKLLSEMYEYRTYLVVLREINGLITSQISQAIKGVRRFDYLSCQGPLKRYSLDRLFEGVITNEYDLEIRTFNQLVRSPDSYATASEVLQRTFNRPNINLKKIEGIKNKSLGAEGTAILLAYNNIIRMIIGQQELDRLRIEIRDAGRALDDKIMQNFPTQHKFCPFSETEQSRFNDRQLKRSQKFIAYAPGAWVDEVFTPVINKKSIVLLSQLDSADRSVAVEMLEHHIHKILRQCSPLNKSISHTTVTDAIAVFLKDETKLVLGD
ncbi:hypothetical protein [Amphritea sp. HPY]|uniref:hypothetical protein n=1 Tax=Amphritea sp. HPY TaxID=3421652 RepID=UPI003D7C3AB9